MAEPATPYDVVVVGAGPGGSAAAIDAARAGNRVAVVERDEFPRFHIGESLTGVVAETLREWGLTDKLLEGDPVTKHGTYVFGSSKSSFYIPVVSVGEDGTRTKAHAWQVDRAMFDQVLLDHAVECGATLIRGTATAAMTTDDGAVTGVQVESSEGTRDVRARFVIDGSGQGRFMQKQGLTGEMHRGRYGAQVAFFTHLHGVDRTAEREADNTRIFYAGPNRWGWLIPVTSDVTSLGLVQPSSHFRSFGETPTEFVEREMRELHPVLAELIANATRCRPVESAHNFSYQVTDFAGPGWMAVGDAHRFVDPIFSLGVGCAMLEGREAARRCNEAIANDLTAHQAYEELFAGFVDWADGGVDLVEELIDGFWGNPTGFGYLAHRKHHDDIVDMFAGRIYGRTTPSAGEEAVRRLALSVRGAA